MGPAFALGKSQPTTDGGSPSFPGNASKRWRSTVSRIVTGDESWVHHSTPETKRQSMVWKKPEKSAPKKAKVTISAGKVMAIVFWDCKGVLLVYYLPPNTTVNAARFCEVLTKLRAAVKRKRPGLLSRKVLLVHDNARPHAARTTQTLLENFKWKIFTHTPYSPDLAPSEFDLFPALKLHLGGKHFANDGEVQAEANHWLRKQDTAWSNSGIKKLLQRFAYIFGFAFIAFYGVYGILNIVHVVQAIIIMKSVTSAEHSFRCCPSLTDAYEETLTHPDIEETIAEFECSPRPLLDAECGQLGLLLHQLGPFLLLLLLEECWWIFSEFFIMVLSDDCGILCFWATSVFFFFSTSISLRICSLTDRDSEFLVCFRSPAMVRKYRKYRYVAFVRVDMHTGQSRDEALVTRLVINKTNKT
ncbi:hypothetical protein LAZ67_3002786 [Cordylochernes scorpioides]|uniref:Transposase n=1 Tax=Cordylochernes scorpioides TaxID=51811 RepID=A0ABY6K808_9ARAC|nr:hypothetical protein LAZ67_3002786 [Cordylochernes scorpioides]